VLAVTAGAALFATVAAVPGPAFAAVAALTTAGRATLAGGACLAASCACSRALIKLAASPGLDARDRSNTGALRAAVFAPAPPLPGLRFT
jgi:hypothetical protein